MTLKDIAKEANVSISTVSRVINGKGKTAASQEVCDRIWEIVHRTNYIPNGAAQNLRTRKGREEEESAGCVECFLARMPFSEKDQFFSELARSMERQSLSLNYDVKYSFTTRGLSHQSASRELSESEAKGLAILGRCDKQIFSLLRQHFRSICYVGLNSLNGNCDQVICDGMEASRAAVNYLISLGHTRIGYLGEIRDEIRYLGYRNAMIDNKLPTESRYAVNAKLSYKGGYEGAKTLLKASSDISAIFCANDITAIGAMSAIKELGLRVPQDISVIGVDNIEASRYMSPALTTISIPITEMGETAAKVLVDRIRGGHQEPVKVILPFRLEIRESCGKPKESKTSVEQKEVK